VASTRLSRHHGALQNALAAATYLGQIAQPCLEEGVNIDAIARLEGSDVLWDQEEMSASIRMLQDIVQGVDLRSQDMKVGRPELLAKLVRISSLLVCYVVADVNIGSPYIGSTAREARRDHH